MFCLAAKLGLKAAIRNMGVVRLSHLNLGCVSMLVETNRYS
jgi:hypothetical protein